MKQLPPSVTIPLSLFVGACVGALEATPGSALLSVATAKPAIATALLAGFVAVVHFYQDSAKKSIAAAPVAEAEKKALTAAADAVGNAAVAALTPDPAVVKVSQ